MGLPTGYTETTSPLRRFSDMLPQYQVQSVLLKLPPKTTSDLEPILTDIYPTEQTVKHVTKEANCLWSGIAIKHVWDIGLENYTFPKKLSFMVMEKYCFLTSCTGNVRELGLVAKMRFADKREDGKVLLCDMISARLWGVRLSERYVWFEFMGVVEVPAHRV